MLNDTTSSLQPTTKLQPYRLGLTWGMQDIARGTYSLDSARHLATSFSADESTAAIVLDGYADAEDDTWDSRRSSDGSWVYTQW